MSRSKPTSGAPNPAGRFYEWAGGKDGGAVTYYDKATKENVSVTLPFTFLLLDELATVKGWNDASDSGIYANEVRDIAKDIMTVKAFKGGVLGAGPYPAIKDSVKAQGGKFYASLYIACDGAIANLGLKGAALKEWMDFKQANRALLYTNAISITGFKDGKKGSISFRSPVFEFAAAKAPQLAEALAMDGELQAYLDGYMKRSNASDATSEVDLDEATAREMASKEAMADDELAF